MHKQKSTFEGETSIISLENIKKKKSTEGREVQMDVRPGTGAHRVRCCNLTLRLILGFRTYIGLKVFNWGYNGRTGRFICLKKTPVCLEWRKNGVYCFFSKIGSFLQLFDVCAFSWLLNATSTIKSIGQWVGLVGRVVEFFFLEISCWNIPFHGYGIEWLITWRETIETI